MTLKEKLEKAKEEGKTVSIRTSSEWLISGRILEIGEDYCVIEEKKYGSNKEIVPLSGIAFLSIDQGG